MYKPAQRGNQLITSDDCSIGAATSWMLGPLGETLQVLGAAGGDSTQNHPGVLREKPEGFVHCQHLQPRDPKLRKISGNPVEPSF